MTVWGGLRRRWPVLTVGIVVAGVVGSGGLAYAFPSVAAITCPTCFGLAEVAPNVYAEPS